MNRIRRLFATTLLTLVLAASPTLAGDMPFGITSSQPPASQATTIDSATEVMLSLLQSLLALF
jgi:hypothetical protein